MGLELVSLTGADDNVSVTDLRYFSAQYPHTEWAILYFPEKEGTLRNPSASWRETFLACNFPHTAAHLCGSTIFRELLNVNTARQRIEDLSRYSRVQININARHPEFTLLEIYRIYNILMASNIDIILQYHDSSAQIIDSYLEGLSYVHSLQVGVLFDGSKGKGQSPTSWRQPISGIKCGYAGGLGPDVIETEFPKIQSAAGAAPFWIDMETGIRTDNEFSLMKVQQVLSYCFGGE